VSIVFTGLCALVTGADQRPAQVLLVDARALGQALPEHAPTLVASLGIVANSESSAPDRVVAAVPGVGFGSLEQIGIWDLTGTEVRIRVPGARGGVELYEPAEGASAWPRAPRPSDGVEAWRDLRYVPDMRRLAGDGRIDPALVGESGSTTVSLPPRVASRIVLDTGLLEAGAPSQKVFRESTFDFGVAGGESRATQAVTDAVRWTVETPGQAVVLEIVPVDGRPVRRLVLAARSGLNELFVSNLPSEGGAAGHHGATDDELAALHFGAYYELLLHLPEARPIPRRSVNAAHRKSTGLTGSTMCPPGHFYY
jgi:hypothetical protein